MKALPVDQRRFAPARIIVCESSGRWAVALRRELSGADDLLVESRSLAECEEMLRERPYSFAVVECSPAGARAVLEFLLRGREEFPRAAFAAAIDRSMRDLAPLLIEAGAVHVVYGTRRLAPLTSMAQRQIALAPRPQLSWREEITARLPWPRAAGA